MPTTTPSSIMKKRTTNLGMGPIFLDRTEDATAEDSFTSTPKLRLYVRNFLAVFVYFLVGTLFYVYYENWTALDSWYFTMVTIGTVGYGDISPSDDNSRLFTVFYMIIGIYLIFYILYYVMTHGLKKVRNAILYRAKNGGAVSAYFVSLVKRALLWLHSVYPSSVTLKVDNKHAKSDQDNADTGAPNEIIYLNRKQRLMFAVGYLVIIVLLGAAILHVNEDYSFITALHLAVQTSTSVGYGDVTVKYRSTKLFLIFYIAFSTGLVIYILNMLHIINKSNRDIKKRQKLFTQLDSFNESLNTLHKIMGPPRRTFSRIGHDHSASISMHSLKHLSSPDFHPRLTHRNTNDLTHSKSFAELHAFAQEGDGIGSFSVFDPEEELEEIGLNEYQFVMFMLRHLQIISHHKHIQPWIKKFHELDHDGKGFITLEELRKFCNIDKSDRSQGERSRPQSTASFSYPLQSLQSAAKHEASSVVSDCENPMNALRSDSDEGPATPQKESREKGKEDDEDYFKAAKHVLEEIEEKEDEEEEEVDEEDDEKSIHSEKEEEEDSAAKDVLEEMEERGHEEEEKLHVDPEETQEIKEEETHQNEDIMV